MEQVFINQDVNCSAMGNGLPRFPAHVPCSYALAALPRGNMGLASHYEAKQDFISYY